MLWRLGVQMSLQGLKEAYFYPCLFSPSYTLNNSGWETRIWVQYIHEPRQLVHSCYEHPFHIYKDRLRVLLTGWKRKQVSLCLSRLCFSWVLCLPPTPKWRDSCGGLWVNCSLKWLLFYLISVKASKLIQVDWVKALDSGYAGHLMVLAVLFRSFSTVLKTSQGSPFVDYLGRIYQNESPLTYRLLCT